MIDCMIANSNFKSKIFVCSPLKPYGKYSIDDNIKQAEYFCRSIVLEGHIPIAPHVYFTRFLGDTNFAERKIGFECGIELLTICDSMNCYIINGYVSEGMKKEIEIAKKFPNFKINKRGVLFSL